MNADGSGLKRLTNDPDNDDVDPAWSPDGTKIAFAKGPKNRVGFTIEPPTRHFSSGGVITTRINLYLMEANGTNPLVLVSSDGANTAPSWSPDGQQIVFYHNDGNNLRFEVVSPSGQNRRVFANYGGQKATFSPNNTEVVVSSNEVYKFRVSDKQVQILTNDQATDSQSVATNPDWK